MSKQRTNLATALGVLLEPQQYQLPNLCVLAGGDSFLKHETRCALLGKASSAANDDLGEVYLQGRNIEYRDLLDALRERSLFGSSQQIVVLEEADSFVKQYRSALEILFEKPVRDAVLILEVDSWPGNTRLAKMLTGGLTVSCHVPERGRERTEFIKQLKQWLAAVAKREHDCQLQASAVEALIQHLPPEPGILYQEVARLALLVPAGQPIDAPLVNEHVGGWRAQKTWDMIDAVAEGKAADALVQLDRLLAAGEEPHALLPQMASTLRKFAAAARVYEQAERSGNRVSLRTALEQSGMPAFKLHAAESQLKQIGRVRAKQLYHWLLAADLALKGHNSTKDRARRELETLVIRLAAQAAPEPAARR